MDDLRVPTGELKVCTKTNVVSNTANGIQGCASSENQARKMACENFAPTWAPQDSAEYTWGESQCVLDNGSYKLKTGGTRHYSNGDSLPTTNWKSLYFSNFTNETKYSCPPNGAPEYEHVVDSDIHPSGQACAKEKDFCPEPNTGGPDEFTGGFGEQRTVCYENEDGTQCKIETDENGGYYHPFKYGTQEPVQCKRPPNKEVDKTSPPEEKPAPEDTDDTPEMAELDALNKINENLDAMNQNQIDASDSNDNRLDRIAEEVQIGNEILGEIRFNTSMIELNTHSANGFLEGILNKPVGGGGDGSGGNKPCTGDDCKPCEGENCPPEKTFTVQAKRKNNEKGLNSIFTDEDRLAVTEEITEKRQEIKDYIDKVKSDATKLFEINPSFGGGYVQRMETIKGVQVDLGVGRFANFFQLLAAALMLISTLTALYILLGT